MKALGFLSSIVLLGLTAAHGQAVKDPREPNPVRVSSRAQLIASLEQASVRVGDPITLHFRLRNVSSEAINVVTFGFNEDSWLIVTDSSGAELPLTKEGDRLRQRSKMNPAGSHGLSRAWSRVRRRRY
jgi:hypothetical protein